MPFAFNQIGNPEKEFPGIRVFGTLGWIVAGLGIGLMKVEATSVPMKVAAGCSVLAGLFAFAHQDSWHWSPTASVC